MGADNNVGTYTWQQISNKLLLLARKCKSGGHRAAKAAAVLGRRKEPPSPCPMAASRTTVRILSASLCERDAVLAVI